MSTRLAVQLGVLAGMITYLCFIAIEPRPTLLGMMADLYLAVAIPVFIIQQAGTR